MRLQTLYLPSAQTGAFALVVDRAPADLPPAEVEALRQFGRDIGAAGTLITATTVDIPVELTLDAEPETTDGATVEVDGPSLGAVVARAVRTYLETQGGTLRGPG